jgi:hypothetical protein
MDTQDPRPAWRQLLLLLPVMIGLTALEARAPFSEPVHTAATVGILVLTYALVGLWVRANRLALTRANHLVTLVRRSQEKVVRENGCGRYPLARPLQALPPETRKGCNDNEESGPSQVSSPVRMPVEITEG